MNIAHSGVQRYKKKRTPAREMRFFVQRTTIGATVQSLKATKTTFTHASMDSVLYPMAGNSGELKVKFFEKSLCICGKITTFAAKLVNFGKNELLCITLIVYHSEKRNAEIGFYH